MHVCNVAPVDDGNDGVGPDIVTIHAFELLTYLVCYTYAFGCLSLVGILCWLSSALAPMRFSAVILLAQPVAGWCSRLPEVR